MKCQARVHVLQPLSVPQQFVFLLHAVRSAKTVLSLAADIDAQFWKQEDMHSANYLRMWRRARCRSLEMVLEKEQQLGRVLQCSFQGAPSTVVASLCWFLPMCEGMKHIKMNMS